MKNFYIIYIILITIFFIYVVLDTFLIPKGEITIIKQENSEISLEAKYIDTSYEDESIKINILTNRLYNTTYYIADITINNIDYLKTAFANNTFGRNIKQTTSTIAKNNNAILAINGDYYGFRDYGFVLRNGVIYRSTIKNNNEDLVIYSDGSFEIINESNTKINEIANNALQIFSFGPSLVSNNQITVSTNQEVSQSMTSNPRTAIGLIDNLHYIFIVSDGRTDESEGLTLYELASILKNLNCTTAYNLDGGGSSTMWFNGNIINNPTSGNRSGERSISDIIYVGY